MRSLWVPRKSSHKNQILIVFISDSGTVSGEGDSFVALGVPGFRFTLRQDQGGRGCLLAIRML